MFTGRTQINIFAYILLSVKKKTLTCALNDFFFSKVLWHYIARWTSVGQLMKHWDL